MKADIPLDYAVFQLSPKRSRCELFISSDGNTEKLASGLVKPFVTHLKFAEEQVAGAVQSIKLEAGKYDNAENWFTKGTLERFVRFVSTPEVLELVNTFEAEMSQLEAARKIYSQGSRDQLAGAMGGDGTGATAATDATKKELLRAIDVRLDAVKQDLNTAYARAASAGFNPETVSELRQFAHQFGAHRLNEACTKFGSVCQRRPDLIGPWKPGVNDQTVRASWGSDMSIDDPTEDQSGPHQLSQNKPQNSSGQDQQRQQSTTQSQHLLNQSKTSTCEQPKSVFLSKQRQRNQDENNEIEKKKEEEAVPVTESSTTQTSRRLSVQDRINLFENKQKESSSGSGSKPVIVGKSVELRRLSSDVSSSAANAAAGSVEKSVLRRWSGASDMSIDLGNERKENNSLESPVCTPSSSSVSQSKSNVFSDLSGDNKDQKDKKKLTDSASSGKLEVKSVGDKVGDSGLKEQGEGQLRVGRSSFKEEEVGLKGGKNWKDQVGLQASLLKTFTNCTEEVGVGDQGVSQEKLKGSLSGGEESDQLKVGAEETVVKNQAASGTQTRNFVGRVGDFTSDGETGSRVEGVEPLDQLKSQSRFGGSQSHSRSLSGQFEIGVKVREARDKRSAIDQLTSQPQWRSFSESEVGKDFVPSAKEPSKVDDSGSLRMKFQKQIAAGPEQIKKLQGRRNESSSVYGNNKPVFPGKRASEGQEGFGMIQTPPVEQVQRIRQSKGNQELNDELKMKANELEKLFAEHKLRVPGDQSSSTRRSKPADVQIEQAISSQHRKPAVSEISPVQLPDKSTVIEPSGSSSNAAKFSTPPVKTLDNQDHGDTLKQNFSELSFSDESRGKFYERYMQKRDAKLKEEWSSKRAEKESKLKAMQDSLERSRAEMKAKFSGSADRQDSVSNAHRRAEKLRSFNFRSTLKIEQHPITSIQSEEDEDLSEIFEQKYYGQDRSFSETSLGDNGSRNSQAKKPLPNRSLSSSTPRTAAPIPRSSAKVSNSGSGRRRPQSENPLAQSVPNFSDFRKENTKPSSAGSKVTTRSQLRNYARSKSSSEDPLVKEEKPRRSNSLRKSSGPVEFSDMPHLNSDGVVLTPLKFDKEQTDQGLQDKYLKGLESKPFLRKGNGIGPGSGASIAKLKASMAVEHLRNEDDYDELAFEAEDSAGMAKEDEEEELETMDIEECTDVDNGKSRLSQGSDKVGNSGSENGDSLRSLSQVDPGSVAELPVTVASTYHAVGSLQESPGESPVSWNSRMHHPFSYPHETSDIDASVDSPIGSPASWNSHSLTQRDADAARMRKKWGSAQKPFLTSNSAHNQSRKDVTKGFKRLLKFGRKNRGTESSVDWISATTSEGDDDTEDGRDPANRSSEDLRKSRMGFMQGHPSDDGFHESELFNEQAESLHSSIPAPPANFKLREDHMSGSSIKAPRSFFSLSTFRSKGSDSKLR